MNDDKQQMEQLMYGQSLDLLLPSGFEVTIREQNGADDDILSNKATSADLTNLDIFLSSLILKTNLPFAINSKLSMADISKMLLRDKYFILFASRKHSMGDNVKIQFDWGDDNGGKLEYIESISNFLWDYKEDLPEEGSEGYFEDRIKPYSGKPYEIIEIEIGSKNLRFNLLNGQGEKYLMKKPLAEQTRNLELKARNLQQLTGDKWIRVENFQFFTKREMAQLHKLVKELDPNFKGVTDLTNPTTKETVAYPILGSDSFFYPEEI